MESLPETTYRYIARSPAVCGGRPVIAGTRTAVQTIVGYYKLGYSAEEILEGLPHVTPAQLFEALSYYHDHADEIEQDIEASRGERIIERYGLSVTDDGRIVSVGAGG
jgi:uncharacterized protein (DUF433 family)